MKKRFFLFAFIVIVSLAFFSCEYYSTTASKLIDFRGDVPNPENTTPYTNSEVETQLALRSDHVCLMFAKTLSIGSGSSDDGEYVGIDGGIGNISTGHILLVASNGKNTENWPTPSKDSTVHCQKIGKYAGADVWGIIIPRTFFTNVGEDDPSLVFSWKFVWSEGAWEDSQQQAGVSPFINPADYNNCTAKLNTTDYTEAQNF